MFLSRKIRGKCTSYLHQGVHKQDDFRELEASLAYLLRSRTARATERPSLEKLEKKKTKNSPGILQIPVPTLTP